MNMKTILAYILVSLLVFSGCGRPAPLDEDPVNQDIEQPVVEPTLPEEQEPETEKPSEEQEPVVESPKEFSLDDFQYGILNHQDEPDDIVRKMGTPLREVEEYDTLFEQWFLDYYYPGIEIRFEDWDNAYYLRSVSVTEPGIAGPRGIEVGMSGDQVMAQFPKLGLPRESEQMLYGIPMTGNRGTAYWHGSELTDIFYVYEPEGWIPTVFRVTLDKNVVVLYELYLATT
jgi:hypothetical protein